MAKTNHYPPLPHDMIVDVLARVANHSLHDFFNAKSSCREWNELGDDDHYIYKRASLNKIPMVTAWIKQKSKKRKTSLFLHKCINAGNPEALYRRGVVDYLRCKKPEQALECLNNAANAGHTGAAYALCIFSIFLGGENKKRGIVVLAGMKETRKAREQLTTIIRSMKVSNVHLSGPKPVCCTATNHQYRSINTGWRSIDDDDDYHDEDCAICKCDTEVSRVHKALLSTQSFFRQQ